jgi:hypothetical protein
VGHALDACSATTAIVSAAAMIVPPVILTMMMPLIAGKVQESFGSADRHLLSQP